jgi:hypothetical protein
MVLDNTSKKGRKMRLNKGIAGGNKERNKTRQIRSKTKGNVQEKKPPTEQQTFHVTRSCFIAWCLYAHLFGLSTQWPVLRNPETGHWLCTSPLLDPILSRSSS